MLEIWKEPYGRRSTIITSELPGRQVARRHRRCTYADAILDRLVHNAQRVDLAGKSLRRKRAAKTALNDWRSH
ncbi:MAG: ATP-binding protein [Rhodospirillales bacterium]|nr:ATP-binding protein [Rhodospirillales bacterium]